MSTKARGRGPVSIVALAVLTGAALGASTVAMLLRPDPPDELTARAAVDVVAVGEEDFSDTRQLTLRLTVESSRTLVAPRGGLLTASACVPGAPIESGTSPFAIDGVAMWALGSSTPFWRSLAPGDVGDDVRSLHVALRDLGYEAPEGDRFEAATLSALEALAAERDASSVLSGGVFDASAVIWIPGEGEPVHRCVIEPGMRVDPGSSVIAMAMRIEAARLLGLPADAVSGTRVVRGRDFEIEIGPSGELEQAASAALRSSADVADLLGGGAGPGEFELPVTWALVDPVSVGVVPPAAIGAGGGGRQCVWAAVGGRSTPVAVVGSELGRTFVLAETDAVLPELVRLDVASRGVACD